MGRKDTDLYPIYLNILQLNCWNVVTTIQSSLSVYFNLIYYTIDKKLTYKTFFVCRSRRFLKKRFFEKQTKKKNRIKERVEVLVSSCVILNFKIVTKNILFRFSEVIRVWHRILILELIWNKWTYNIFRKQERNPNRTV